MSLDATGRHPRLQGLGRTPAEQARLEALAVDLARHLHGEGDAELGALARVVTRVARRELADPQRLCRGRPLLAVEAAARAAELLWPLLRGPLEEDPPPPQETEPGDEGEAGEEEGAQGAGGGGGAAEGAGEGEEGNDDGEDGEDGKGGQDGQDGEGDQDGEDAEGAEDGDDGDDGEDGEDGDDGQDGEDGDDAEDGEDAEDGDDGDDGDDAEDLNPDDPLPPELEDLAERLARVLAPAEAPSPLDEIGAAACDGALEADRLARELEALAPGVGWSQATGHLQRTLLEDLSLLGRLLERLDTLRELADALGRVEEAERGVGTQHGGGEEVVGVHLGGEVARALPSELGLLGDPSTEDLFYQRFLERRLVSLELTGAGLYGSARGERRGPVIACIDTSGSMQGAPEMAAKALVLAVCRKVLPQDRLVHLLLFGGPGEQAELRLRKGPAAIAGLLQFLAWSFAAGTDFDTPLLRALALLEERDLARADILVVTDGMARATADIVERVDAARQGRGLRVWSVVLGHTPTAGVDPFSDEVWQCAPREAVRAVGLLRRIER